MCLSAVLGIGSSLIGASGAKKAANAQQQASADQLALSERIYDETTQRFQPWLSAGQNALGAYLYEMGLGPAPTVGGQAPQITEITDSTPGEWNYNMGDRGTPQGWYGPNGAYSRGGPGSAPNTTTRYSVNGNVFDSRDAATQYANANPTGGTEYGGYTKTPGFDFRLNEGLDATQALANKGAGLFSGASMKATNRYAQDYATGEYNNYLAKLAGLAGGGMSAAGNQAAAGANFMNAGNNAYANMGNAGAAGAIGTANAWQGGLNSINQYLGYQNAQPGMAPPATNYAPANSLRPVVRPW